MNRKSLFALLSLLPMAAVAQLKVNGNGSVNLGTTTTAQVKAVVGSPVGLGNVNIGLSSGVSSLTQTRNVGVVGSAFHPTQTSLSEAKYAAGVFGVSLNALMNYGTIGVVTSGSYGAGVLGTIDDNIPAFAGTYAAYFNGPVKTNSTTTTSALLIPSDIRLKENIESLSESSNSALDNVLSMNVLKYNYKERDDEKYIDSGLDLGSVAETATPLKQRKSGELHFGVSAQELQTIYPNLVVEGQDGYLSVNYVELVPILIRSIQELKQQVDALSGEKVAQTRALGSATSVNDANRQKSVLYQNSPNPFKERTEIRFSIADNARNAYICIFDLQGKLLKRIPLGLSDTSVSIDGYELGAGMYLYSLIVDGQEIDTKRMILNK